MSRSDRRPGPSVLLVFAAVAFGSGEALAEAAAADGSPPGGVAVADTASSSDVASSSTEAFSPPTASVAVGARDTPAARPATVALPSRPDRPLAAALGGDLFRRRVRRAAARVADELKTARGASCRDYFAEQGIDVLAWLELAGPPYFKEVEPRRLDRTCAWSQPSPPFEWVFVCSLCLYERDPCPLGSLLLHELGHLARRDSHDNEPTDFLVRCRVSSCIDVGRYR